MTRTDLRSLAAATLLLLLGACAATRPAASPAATAGAAPPPACSTATPPLFAGPTCDEAHPLEHELLQSVLWMQHSAEYTANALQAYNVATLSLERALANPRKWTDAVAPEPSTPKSKYAVIVDVDETLLDNSPAEVAFMAADCHKFDVGLWSAWEKHGKAKAIPGAVDFLKAVAKRHVAIFYVTNRSNENRAALTKNLQDLEFPLPMGDQSLLLPPDCETTAKECRRKKVVKDYRVLLAVGDDFGDFMDLTGKTLDERIAAANANRERWGREWIILPNPIYGSWDRVFYNDKTDSGATILTKKCKALTPPSP